MTMTYCIVTFGCAANVADSQRIASALESKGYVPESDPLKAQHVVINTCMVRQMAEDRVYGLYQNLIKLDHKPKIVVTGCMVGTALREPTGTYFDKIRNLMPLVDEFLPIEEVGFEHNPLRTNAKHALIPISNGCNNFCTFCVVPFSRGREISRPFADIITECEHVAGHGFTHITLVGQNVNSYGADLIVGADNIQVLRDKTTPYFPAPSATPSVYQLPDGTTVYPTYVKHLGKSRIPTLFPQLLSYICDHFPELKIDFISSNPWDFSDDLINVIAKYPQISRQLHLPIQSGSDRILRKMNRWYTRAEYLNVVKKLQSHIPDLSLTTDIIVGFPSETEADFNDTFELAQTVGFTKAYVARYSPRPGTAATQSLNDDVSHKIKKARWNKLDTLINGYPH